MAVQDTKLQISKLVSNLSNLINSTPTTQAATNQNTSVNNGSKTTTIPVKIIS